MEKKYKIILSIITIVFLILILIGIGYTFYKNKSNKNAAEVIIDENLSINYMNGRKYEFNDKEKEINFSIINDSNDESMFHIVLNDVSIDNQNVSYKLFENNNFKTGNDLSNSTYYTISSFVNIEGNGTKSYKLVINNPSKNTVKFTLNVEKSSQEDPNFSQLILNNNLINKESKTDIGTNSSVIDEGLIMDIDDNGNTFYFRGNVKNNYVYFANKMWRIVRINGDGTVKIILDENADKSNVYEETLSDRINSLAKKSNNKIYSYLELWYQNNLKDYDKYIALSKYCVDLTKEKDNMANYNRINISNNPTFNCLGETYSSKIGTLSVDEVIYAGASINEQNQYYYLYNSNIKDTWWTMSAFKDGVEGLYFYEISSNGEILMNSTGDVSKGIRPVINLNENIEMTGEGTLENPYKVK